MRPRTPLTRLERKAPPPSRADGSGDAFDMAYPAGLKPDDWFFRLRVAHCGEAWLSGLLRPDEYLPDMEEGERRYADGLTRAFAGASGSAPGETDLAGGRE